MFSLGKSCSHVAAVLFKVEAAVRLGYTSKASTDVACKWNVAYVKKVQPAPIADITLSRKELSEQPSSSRSMPSQRTGDDELTESQHDFLQELSTLAKPVCLSVFDETCELFKPSAAPPPVIALPSSLRSLHQQHLIGADIEAVSTYCLSVDISVSLDEIDAVEQSTILQADSVTWHEQRTGRITASVAHKILKTDICNPPYSLILSLTSISHTKLNVPPVIYSRKHEPIAIDAFKAQLPDLHLGGQVSKTGLRICHGNTWLGASPDALIDCPCHGHGVIEVKCPYSFRDTTVPDMLTSPKCCLGDDGTLKRTHQYYTQLQIQMFVYNVQFGVLLLYIGGSLVVANVERDEVFLQNSIPILHSFWQQHILPELVTRRLELRDREQPVVPQQICYCKRSQDEQQSLIVKCSGKSCPFGGFIHLECIRPKRKTVPRKDWWCKECRKNK